MNRKLFAIVLSAALCTAALTACGPKEPAAEPTPTPAENVLTTPEANPTEVPPTPGIDPAATVTPDPDLVEGQGGLNGVELSNPMVSVDSAAAFAPLGVTIEAPTGAQNPAYFIIGDGIAEIQYTMDGCDFIYRAAVTDEEDISGVYETFSEDVLLEESDGEDWSYALTVNTIENGGGTVGLWQHNGVSYSLFSPQVTVPEDLSNYAAELCIATAPRYSAEDAPPTDE